MRFRAISRKLSAPISAGARGVTLLELVVSVAVALTIAGMAIPVISRTMRAYQLNDAATQVAGIVKFTRFEAIRENKPVRCINSQATALGQASLWSDSDGDGIEGSLEKQILLGVSATLITADVAPNVSGLSSAVGATLQPIDPATDSIKFDQRGAVVANPSAVYVYYIGNTSEMGGFRAVVVLPSGAVQVWTYAGGAGNAWQEIS
jgi:Tfp pilus assembly protein FimT